MPHVQLEHYLATECCRIGDWLIDSNVDEIRRDGERVKLEPRMMKLLLKLAEHPGEVVSSQQLLDAVWCGLVVGSASVYQGISQLRKVLGDTDLEPSYIATIPRKGYRLVAPVRRQPDIAPQVGEPDAPPPAIDTVANVSDASRPKARKRQLLFSLGAAAFLVLAAVLVRPFASVQEHTVAPRSATRAPVILDARTVAVLPFEEAYHDESQQPLAPVLTDLVRTRFALLLDYVTIASGSTAHALRTHSDPSALARKLNARYLLNGGVTRKGDVVSVNATLIDASTKAEVWSAQAQRPIAELAAIPDEIVRRAAEFLPTSVGEAARSAEPSTPVDLQAYDLYLRAQQLTRTYRAADAQQAAAMLARVTALDPSFARGYYAYGMALLLAADLGAREMTEELRRDAGKAFDRAIELNPRLGEAWAQRARLTSDPVKAEEFFRRGLQLAPGHDESYVRFSDFLFSQRRRGEALELVDRARRIDPLSPAISWRKSQFLIAARSDVAGSQQLLREALEVLPDFPTALRELANSRWLYSGDDAEAIGLVEKSMALDGNSNRADSIAVGLYLSLDDPGSASAVLHGTHRPDSFESRLQWVDIKMFEGDTMAASELSRDLVGQLLIDGARAHAGKDANAYVINYELAARYVMTSNALRDEAIATGDFRTALQLIGGQYQLYCNGSPLRRRGIALVYAHTLMLAGDTRRAQAILDAMLEHMKADSVGRPAHWYAWERATAYAILGDDERALTELEASVRAGRFWQWWYIEGRDPLYDRVRSQPRFQALVEQARKHREHQRSLLEQLRASGVVPRRA